MQRSIDAPDKEWLSAAEAARWIGISRKLFVHLAEELEAPPVKMGHRTLRWNWRDVYAISVMVGWRREQFTTKQGG